MWREERGASLGHADLEAVIAKGVCFPLLGSAALSLVLNLHPSFPLASDSQLRAVTCC